MKRLIERGLMFGNLIRISSPALVERYNRALKQLTGKKTRLKSFHVDISGYSPEVGDSLKDHLYLNEGGCNRQFILLTTEQKTAPLLNAQFSTSRGILRQFYDENEAQLFALTAKDAVAGELLNSVYSVEEAVRLFDIRQVTIEADTTKAHVKSAQALADKIERFKREDDAWWDDVLIAEMIGLAKKTGDVTRAPLRLKKMKFNQDNFWTKHFGGIYLFRTLEHPVAICAGGKADLGKLPINYTFDFNDRNEIAIFLELNDLVEPIVKARGVDAAAILQQKMDFITVDVAAEKGADLSGTTRRDIRALTRKYASDLPEEFYGLAALLRWAQSGGNWPRISSDHPAYFYTLRSKPHADRDLVNMLLAALTPMDIRQLFICHKERFYHSYSAWPDAKKTFVAQFLEREYQVDKAGARAALFGEGEAMEEPVAMPEPEDLIELVGPWGAVRRN
ncbi:MAG: hypothetical protein COB39_00320 [Marinosulfonomonas sp.]|nr:MAG: hypothetical protein COB39_00320 [Marinosulfonomonas sp.]